MRIKSCIERVLPVSEGDQPQSGRHTEACQVTSENDSDAGDDATIAKNQLSTSFHQPSRSGSAGLRWAFSFQSPLLFNFRAYVTVTEKPARKRNMKIANDGRTSFRYSLVPHRPALGTELFVK